MSDEYKPKRAITTINPKEVGPNQVGLLVRVSNIFESPLVLQANGYESEDGGYNYVTLPNDVIEVLL